MTKKYYIYYALVNGDDSGIYEIGPDGELGSGEFPSVEEARQGWGRYVDKHGHRDEAYEVVSIQDQDGNDVEVFQTDHI